MVTLIPILQVNQSHIRDAHFIFLVMEWELTAPFSEGTCESSNSYEALVHIYKLPAKALLLRYSNIDGCYYPE